MDQPSNEFWCELAHKVIDLLTPSVSDIWSSPAKLTILLDICRSLTEIGKEAETVGINQALQNKELPGYSLVRRERNGYVEALAIQSLLESLAIKDFFKVLPEILAWSDNVSEKRYRELCELLGREPDKTAIKQSTNSVFLRRNPQPSNPLTERKYDA
jgi:hypothetical protein